MMTGDGRYALVPGFAAYQPLLRTGWEHRLSRQPLPLRG